MPELVRSVVSRFQVFFEDRRQSPRLPVRLLFTVALHRTTKGLMLRKRLQVLRGHTKDISVKGVCLLVPQIHLDGRHLAADGRALEVQLEMGNGEPISMLVAPNRYERLEDAELGCSYLIGTHIVSMDEGDRVRYESFINDRLQAQPA
ncbi:MAG TPA: PilZ domain-containing protein [Pyrinomonadaceae bacterium]|nr:PilZ domain-containing protein [Pyrinomonadaceae bacterium]